MIQHARRMWAAGSALACGLTLAVLAGTLPAQAAPGNPATSAPAGTVTKPETTPGKGTAGARERASAAVEAMMSFYDKASGRWQPEEPWWQSGNALQSLLDYSAKTGSRKYMWAIENTIEQQRKPLPWWPEGNGEFRADSTDDTGWWALAMTRVYDITRDTKYLEIAKTDEAYIHQYWDDFCGGGVWWDLPAKTYKNAISVELYIKLLAALHNRIPGDKLYLGRAVEAWNWFKKSGMINGEHLVNDGLQTQGGKCDSNLGTTWTYNQGVILGGLAELYKGTGDRSLLADARKIADAVISSPSLSPKGILTEPCEVTTCNSDGASFKGIFVRNLSELDRVVPGHPYRSYLLNQARSAYAYDRNSANLYGLRWAGPFDHSNIGRQTAAVSLLTSVL
ncbi:glycoside hydrolase family 76 protein [Planotetraspora sp. A-T 1434]|uniref:glycoside hydrolase family 76 protein n=1 Tax=Planotetraspora sp. A-T 1434 TaxID=2979219 RepID=UPI0021BF2137|nr:glycoside hydrolase family 76 protein [Planotetraspora sp. A-T 1434]MCT9929032.1 glycoside hydrolase family 76 protein [Planotetraspora sp. A-T 1434]